MSSLLKTVRSWNYRNKNADLQDELFLYHLGPFYSRNNKQCPPWNARWPRREFVGSSIETFIDKLKSPEVILIMRDEVDKETEAMQYLSTAVAPDPSIGKYWNKGSETWQSWSLRLQIEDTFGDEAKIANAPSSFLSKMCVKFAGEEKTKEKRLETMIRLVRKLKDWFQSISTTMFLFYYARKEQNVRDKHLYSEVKKARWLRRDYPDSTQWTSITKDVIMGTWEKSETSLVVEKKKTEVAEKNLLELANVINEDDLWVAARKLMREAYKKDPLGQVKLIKNKSKESINRVIAGLCLLQLGLGSRSRGVIGVNFVKRVTWPIIGSASEQEFEKELGDRPQDIRAAYAGSTKYCVTVTRLSKEGEKEALALKEYFSGKRDIKEGEEELTEVEMKKVGEIIEKIRHRIVTKPILWMFFDPLVILENEEAKEAELLDPVDVLLQLLEEVRNYLRWFYRGKKWLRWIENPEVKGQYALADNLIGGNIEVDQKFFKVWSQWMRNMVKNVFPKLNFKGTHDLRRLYVVYGYEKLAGPRLKETAFAQRVLNHMSYRVSLRYTSLRVKMGLGYHAPVEDTSKTLLSKLQAEIIELKRYVADDKEFFEPVTSSVKKPRIE